MKHPIVLYPGEDDYWVAECPGSPGCISQGQTKEEATLNFPETIQGYIVVLEKDNIQVPDK